jgi:Protein of unknown function (DUF2934)
MCRDKCPLRRNTMTDKSKSLEPRSQEPDLSSDIEERIRERAYELYEQRGRADGFALADWFQAETEIKGEQKQPQARAAIGST